MKRGKFLKYSVLFLVGCSTSTSIKNNKLDDKLATRKEKLKVSVTDVKGAEELNQDYSGFRDKLQEILGKDIQLVPVKNYIEATAALGSNQIDLVLTGPSEYVVIKNRTKAVPVVAISRLNYYSVICVKADSNIKSLQELKGKKIALWDVGSTSGHLGPVYLLISGGINPKSDLEIEMMRSKGLPALINGEVDAWGGSWLKYNNFIKENNLTEKDLPILIKGSQLPDDLVIAGSHLDTQFVSQIQALLVKNQTKLINALASQREGKFINSTVKPVQDSDYDMIRDVYKVIGEGN